MLPATTLQTIASEVLQEKQAQLNKWAQQVADAIYGCCDASARDGDMSRLIEGQDLHGMIPIDLDRSGDDTVFVVMNIVKDIFITNGFSFNINSIDPRLKCPSTTINSIDISWEK
jgi:hypothetical protein